MDRREKTASAKDLRGKAPAKCRSCRASIIWIETVNGRKMPCNWPAKQWQPPTDPNRPLTVMVPAPDDPEDPGYLGDNVCEAVRVTSDDTEMVEGYEPHFATCPKSKRHRRKR